MKPKFVLVLSLLLNLVMAVWIARLLSPNAGPAIDAPAASVSPESSTVGARGYTAANVAPGSEGASQHPSFGWRQVESEDYRQYLANLRAIGCPERTIKDIVVSDVNDLFATRAAALTQTNQYQYWRNQPVSRTEEQERQLRDLWAEKRDVLRTLGFEAPDFAGLLADAFHDTMLEGKLQVDFLPEPKRQQIRDALLRAAEQALVEGNNPARNDAIEQEALTQVESLLTPEEFHEYELRASTDAQRLRGTLDSLALTEGEFRAIFDSWRELKAVGPGTPEQREIQQASEVALQQLLGPDRFLRYLDGVRQWGYPN